MFSVVADIPVDPTENKARINVLISPEFIDIIRIEPQVVEYLILQE